MILYIQIQITSKNPSHYSLTTPSRITLARTRLVLRLGRPLRLLLQLGRIIRPSRPLVRLDGLLAVRGELRLPVAGALLLLGEGVGLVLLVVDVCLCNKKC